MSKESEIRAATLDLYAACGHTVMALERLGAGLWEEDHPMRVLLMKCYEALDRFDKAYDLP